MSTAQPQVTGPETKVITITKVPGKPPVVSPTDPVTISKGKNEQVKWECTNCSSGFTVEFNKGTPTPFEKGGRGDPINSHQEQGGKGYAAVSGRAKGEPNKEYKYSVTVDHDEKNKLDPVIILQP